MLAASAAFAIATPVFSQAALEVDWVWKASYYCRTISPELVVSGIPVEAKVLEVRMVDLDFPQFNHGGGSIAATGAPTQTIPEAALTRYVGPCNRGNYYNFGNTYQFTVKALAADGTTELARGVNAKLFSSSTAK